MFPSLFATDPCPGSSLPLALADAVTVSLACPRLPSFATSKPVVHRLPELAATCAALPARAGRARRELVAAIDALPSLTPLLTHRRAHTLVAGEVLDQPNPGVPKRRGRRGWRSSLASPARRLLVSPVKPDPVVRLAALARSCALARRARHRPAAPAIRKLKDGRHLYASIPTCRAQEA